MSAIIEKFTPFIAFHNCVRRHNVCEMCIIGWNMNACLCFGDNLRIFIEIVLHSWLTQWIHISNEITCVAKPWHEEKLVYIIGRSFKVSVYQFNSFFFFSLSISLLLRNICDVFWSFSISDALVFFSWLALDAIKPILNEDEGAKNKEKIKIHSIKMK